MFLARCLKLADENGRLRIENATLRRNLAMTSATLRKAVDEREQARRDVDLLVLCAKDRRAAAEMVQTRHDIEGLEAG